MKDKNVNILERYLKLLRFKKFMIFHVLLFTFGLFMCIYAIAISLLNKNIIGALGYFIGISFTYLIFRVLQFLWITKGADDNYFYFFKGKSKEK
ncbi:MAG: hypothetical protein FH761_15545 [Firmicutes bacterium]|nr:hypothetical protein [Bacillota bacterium]